MYVIKEISQNEWDVQLNKCNKVNMLQSWEYGDAKEKTGKWKPVRFAITVNGEVVGLAQFITRTIPMFGGIARLNRGPLLPCLNDEASAKFLKHDLLQVLLKEARKRFWWVVFIAPEIEYSRQVEEDLLSIGLCQQPSVAYGSGLVNLAKDESQLLMGFKKKWRYYLRKGLDADVVFESTCGEEFDLNELLTRYESLQKNNNFSGLSTSQIHALSEQNSEHWKFVVFTARKVSSNNSEDCLGMVVIITHYDTSTYLIGLTSEEGRRLCINYALLWRAMTSSKNSGCQWFDIGGLDDSTPEGIAHFKRGLNSSLYTLVGEWRFYFLPLLGRLVKCLKLG